MQISTIGIDLAKNVFQVHGVDAAEKLVLKKQLRRSQVLEFFSKLSPCLVGLEACATSHQWARELKKLGHDVRLMPASYVKAYVKRGKNDAADAAAICEAVTRPSMHFVPIKSSEQQSALMLHRTRDLLICQRTQLINAMRAHLAELGLVARKGREGLQQLIRTVAEADDERLPSDACFACQAIIAQLQAVQIQITRLDKRIHQAHRVNPASKRLEAIPGFGVIVSKQGDRYLRRLLIVGALSVVKSARARPDKYPWIMTLLGRRPAKVVAVALANKMARIAWAVLAKGETYRASAHTTSGAVAVST